MFPDLSGVVEGRRVIAADFRLDSHDIRHAPDEIDELMLVFRHPTLPLKIEACYTAWGSTGVFTRRLTLVNTGAGLLRVNFPSLSWSLPAGEYDLTYLYGGWGRERQPVTERLGRAGVRSWRIAVALRTAIPPGSCFTMSASASDTWRNWPGRATGK